MKKSLGLTSLWYSLAFINQLLINNNVEHFCFFGTLLGLTRAGEPIRGDDDVDIYVNRKHRTRLIHLLKDIGLTGFANAGSDQDNHFLQLQTKIGAFDCLIDFYFYDGDSDSNFIIERWNFSVRYRDPQNWLKIPKPFIFPLKLQKFSITDVYMPKFDEIICEFLYGSDWRRPLKKDIDYFIQIVGGRPIRFRKTNDSVALLP